jgi:DNA-directed RNA polymerase subunit M/transcription elongation factor TFIIS
VAVTSPAFRYEPGVFDYTCEGCGKKWHGTQAAAFEAGWDAPPWFTTHVTCESCGIDKTAWWIMTVAGSKG